MMQAGDIQPNPGPATASTSSISSLASVSSAFNFSKLSNHLSVVHYNVQSLVPKLDLLTTELNEFDILAFTETWLNPSVPTNDLTIDSYKIPERKDRPGDSHGGVILYVKNNIHYTRRHDLELRGVESIWIELTLKHKHILFGVFYRPPYSEAVVFSAIEDSINLAVDSDVNDIIITGDFNLNMQNVQSARKIISLCEQLSLVQSIEEPTHFTKTSSSLIDLLLVNNKEHLILSGVDDPFLHQDIRYHCPVFGIFNFRKPKCLSFKRRIWKYDDGNYEMLRQKASATNWNDFQNNDINTYCENLIEHLQSITEMCIPNKVITIRPSDPPWITTLIKRHIRKRKRAYKRAKQTNLPIHWTKFRNLRNRVTQLIRESKQSFNDSMATKLKSDSLSPKQWWKLLKYFIAPNSKSSIPPLETNGQIYAEECEKANILNDFFKDQTLLDERNAEIPDIHSYPVDSPLSNIVLTSDEVESVLKSLPVGKAVGPDGISNRVLKELSREISPALCGFFNQSLHTGIVPDSFKQAYVSPVHKGGDPSEISNYRPISLLSNLDKAFERLIFKYVYNHFLENNILTSFQSGFRRGDSTVNQLSYLYNTFCQALDAGKEVRAIFCDISKAFDRVWHAGLIHKLKSAGISGNLLSWFTNYLTGRKQRVVMSGVQSAWNFISAGVPQGSILGPLLFLLFINDIVHDIGSSIRLFADDTSLYIIVEDPNVAAELLNADLEKIAEWALKWLVKFNPLKTESLLISRKTNTVHPPVFMLDQQIKEVESHKHLDVILSNDCSWQKHIDYIKEKAWTRINIMRRLKYDLDRKSLETIYKSFIRPLLEYADVIWDNCTQQNKNELELIQLEAARISTGATKLVSVANLYIETGWETLDARRNKHKLVLFYKMFNDLTPPYLSSLVPPLVQNASRYNLRNSNDTQTIASRTTLFYNSFLPSSIRDWNRLNPDIRNAGTLDAFKLKLNQNLPVIPKHYYSGIRKYQIWHTRIRTGCSSLKNDLFLKNIIDSPLCTCNSGEIENAYHFFFICQLYTHLRVELRQSITQYCNMTLDVILRGDERLSTNINTTIYEAVHKYIE